MLALLLSQIGFSQSTWRRAYGAFGEDECSVVRKIGSADLLSVGSTGSFGNGSSDVYVIRVNESGDLIWSTTVGGAGVEHGSGAIVTSDEFVYVVGYTNSFGAGGYDGYLAKLDQSGMVIWERSYGGSDWDLLYDIALQVDGSLIMVGTSYSNGNSIGAPWLVNVNVDGEIQWENTYAGSTAREGYSVACTLDGGYVIAGSVAATNGPKDALIMKFNEFGAEEWAYSYGGDSLDIAYDVIQTYDGGYSFVGATHSYSVWTEAYHVRLDYAGNEMWYWNWGQINDQESYEHVELPSGEFVQVGYSKTGGGGGKDMFLMINYPDGNFLFGTTFGGEGDDVGNSIVVLDDGYLCGGVTRSYGAGGKDVFLVRTNPNGLTDLQTVQDSFDPLSVPQLYIPSFPIHPNPASTMINFTPVPGAQEFRIYDSAGRVVQINRASSTTGAIQLGLSEGAYVLEVRDMDRTLQRARFVIQNR